MSFEIGFNPGIQGGSGSGIFVSKAKGSVGCCYCPPVPPIIISPCDTRCDAADSIYYDDFGSYSGWTEYCQFPGNCEWGVDAGDLYHRYIGGGGGTSYIQKDITPIDEVSLEVLINFAWTADTFIKYIVGHVEIEYLGTSSVGDGIWFRAPGFEVGVPIPFPFEPIRLGIYYNPDTPWACCWINDNKANEGEAASGSDIADTVLILESSNVNDDISSRTGFICINGREAGSGPSAVSMPKSVRSWLQELGR